MLSAPVSKSNHPFTLTVFNAAEYNKSPQQLHSLLQALRQRTTKQHELFRSSAPTVWVNNTTT